MSEITFKKVNERGEFDNWLTAYEVTRGADRLGFVWSFQGFSYRGDGGWNSGIRCRDFYPTRWHYGKTLGIALRHRLESESRKQAGERFLQELEREGGQP